MTRILSFHLFMALLCGWSHGIMVKYGTREGPPLPLRPSTPAPLSSRSARAPAPVWEVTANERPDPNANWRPQLFVPQPRYTQVAVNPSLPAPPKPHSNAQKFVNEYLPKKSSNAQGTSKSQVLSSQKLPGYGIQYFIPTYADKSQEINAESVKGNELNDLENVRMEEKHREAADDAIWKYEKEANRRVRGKTQPESPSNFIYQWPRYVPRH